MPSAESGPFEFAQTSYTHIGFAQVGKDALIEALGHIAAELKPPHFIMTTGDLVVRGSNQIK